MYKKITVFLMCFMVFATAASAKELLKIPANEEGQVIVDEKKSIDDNTYILNEATPKQEFNVMQAAATTFTTKDFKNGFFDNPTVEYTTTGFSDFNALIDNEVETTTKSGEIVFKEPIEISGYYIKMNNSTISIYDENNQRVHSYGPFGANTDLYVTLNTKVSKVAFVLRNPHFISEFDLFIVKKIDYITVANLKVETKDVEATVQYENPNSEYWRYNDILLNEKVVKANTKEKAIKLEDLEPETEYNVTVRSYYSDGKFVDSITTFKTRKDSTPPGNVTNLKVKQDFNSMVLTFDKPTDADFSHVKIYRNGLLIADDIKELTFTDLTPLANRENNDRVASVDKTGNRSTGSTTNRFFASTKITNLKAISPDFTKVELSWSNPQYEGFEMVTIYRKNDDVPLMTRVASLFSVTDNYEPIFETNGTVFKDLTVKDDTTYNYKVAATVNGIETDAQFVEIKTPKISVLGSEGEKQGDDFVLKWENPTTGKIKVLISGALYKTVDASTKQLVIPGTAMKYDAFGQPLIQLIPIDENGEEGTPTRPGNSNPGTIGKVEMPEEVTANNLLKISIGLLGVVGGFVLLGLIWVFMPKLINLIRQAFLNKRGAA